MCLLPRDTGHMMELAITRGNRDGDQLICRSTDFWRRIIEMELKKSGLFNFEYFLLRKFIFEFSTKKLK